MRSIARRLQRQWIPILIISEGSIVFGEAFAKNRQLKSDFFAWCLSKG